MSSLATAAFPQTAVSSRGVRRPERNARRRVSGTPVSRGDGPSLRLPPPRALPGVPFPWAPEGTTMDAVLDSLAARVVAAAFFGDGDGDARVFVGIAGSPGSGKSTLARLTRDRVNAAAGDDVCVVFPMDGFHYSMNDLLTNKDGLFPDADVAVKRRGSPFTFDAEAFTARVKKAKAEGSSEDVLAPAFCHETHDPEEDAIVIKAKHKIVLVEGNYVLLPDEPWCALKDLNVLDESWFVDVPVDEAMRRVERRHVAVGRTPAEAKLRADSNDRLNGELVWKHKGRADVFVPSYDMDDV